MCKSKIKALRVQFIKNWRNLNIFGNYYVTGNVLKYWDILKPLIFYLGQWENEWF